MRIKITADSTCDMSAAFIERYQVEVIPLSIELNGKFYKDGIDLKPEEIITQDYLVRSVIGFLPAADQLEPDVEELVRMQANLTPAATKIEPDSVTAES